MQAYTGIFLFAKSTFCLLAQTSFNFKQMSSSLTRVSETNAHHKSDQRGGKKVILQLNYIISGFQNH